MEAFCPSQCALRWPLTALRYHFPLQIIQFQQQNPSQYNYYPHAAQASWPLHIPMLHLLGALHPDWPQVGSLSNYGTTAWPRLLPTYHALVFIAVRPVMKPTLDIPSWMSSRRFGSKSFSLGSLENRDWVQFERNRSEGKGVWAGKEGKLIQWYSTKLVPLGIKPNWLFHVMGTC